MFPSAFFSSFIGEARLSLANKVVALSQAIAKARMLSELSQKSMAADMGLSDAHLSQQLSTHGPNLARLLLLPNRFWLAFLPLLANLAGCDSLLAPPNTTEVASLRAEVAALRQEVLNLAAMRRSA
jgi:hypothetical protein